MNNGFGATENVVQEVLLQGAIGDVPLRGRELGAMFKGAIWRSLNDR